MAKSEQLFELIKSLGKSEKRYFRLFSSMQAGEKIYTKLFDAIEKQKTYNEDDLLKQFKSESFIKRFAMAKNYLYNLILKSMDLCHYNADISKELSNLLKQADFLYQKKLIKHYTKLLKKIKKKALEAEQFNFCLEVSERERRLLSNLPYSKKLKEDIQKCFDEHDEYLKKYNNLNQYLFYDAQLHFLEKQYKSQKDKTDLKKNIDKLIADDIFMNESQALSFNAIYKYYEIKAEYYWIKEDYNESYKYRAALISYVESQEDYLGNKLNFYIPALYNFVNICNHLEKYENVLEGIKKIRTSIDLKKATTQQTLIYLNTFGMKLSTCWILKEFDVGNKIAKEAEQILNHPLFSTYIYPKLIIRVAIASFYFNSKQYDEALDAINDALNDPALKTYNQLHYHARILNLLIHFELGNLFLLDSEIKSTYRFFKEIDMYGKKEKYLFNFLKHYNDLLSKKEKHNLYSSLETNLEDTTNLKNPFYDYKEWIASKK